MKLYKGCHVDTMCARELGDGQVAIIEKLNQCPKSVGKLVQRVDNLIILLGEPYDEGWYVSKTNDNFIVRILPKGTLIEV